MRVLCYHAVTEADDPVWGPFAVSPTVLHEQLRAIRRAGGRFLTGAEALPVMAGRRRPPRRAVLVTVDDGYVDFRDAALPVLRRLEIPSVLFAVTGLLRNDWDVARGATPRALLGPDDLARLARDGDVAIGAHTRTHPILTEVADEALVAELAGARRDLEAAGAAPLPLLAYPYGQHDGRVRAAASAAGYEAACTIERAPVRDDVDPMAVPRAMVMRSWSTAGLLARLVVPEGTRVRLAPGRLRPRAG